MDIEREQTMACEAEGVTRRIVSVLFSVLRA